MFVYLVIPLAVIGIVAAYINHRKFRASTRRNHILLIQLANAYVQLRDAQQKVDSTTDQLVRLSHQGQPRVDPKLHHDLRTPVNLIIGFCEAILTPANRPLNPLSAQDDVNAIYRNAKQLQSLIDSTFAPTPPIASEKKIDPVILIKEVESMTAALMEKQNLSLRLNIVARLPLISGDYVQVRQILLTMLTNAASIVTGGTLALDVAVRESHLLFTVTTTGGEVQRDLDGLPSQRQLAARWNLSQRLAQMHNGHLSTDSAHSIFVLDLPIVAHAPEAHKAIILLEDNPAIIETFRSQITHYEVINVQNVAEIGNLKTKPVAIILSSEPDQAKIGEIASIVGDSIPVITCTMPRHDMTEYLVKPIDYDALAQVLKRFAWPIQKILIIDDNQDNVQMLARMLESMAEKYTVWKAYSGHEGLALLSKQHIDAIILDVVLPDTDGFAVAHSIRAIPDLANIPILLTSAYPDPQALVLPVIEKVSIYQAAGFQTQAFFPAIEALIQTLDSTSDVAPDGIEGLL